MGLPGQKDVAVLGPAAINDRQLFDFFRAQGIILGLFLSKKNPEEKQFPSFTTTKKRFNLITSKCMKLFVYS